MVEEKVNLLKCVGSEIRYKILQTLEEGEKSVREIMEDLDEEQSLVSHHLKSLRECKLISKRREGRKTIYRITDSSVLRFMDQVDDLSKKFCNDTDSPIENADGGSCESNE